MGNLKKLTNKELIKLVKKLKKEVKELETNLNDAINIAEQKNVILDRMNIYEHPNFKEWNDELDEMLPRRR